MTLFKLLKIKYSIFRKSRLLKFLQIIMHSVTKTGIISLYPDLDSNYGSNLLNFVKE